MPELVFNMEFNLKDKHNQTFCSSLVPLNPSVWEEDVSQDERKNDRTGLHSESDGIELLKGIFW